MRRRIYALTMTTALTIFGYAIYCLCAFIAVANFYFALLEGYLYRFMGWPYRWNSGVPILGNVFLVLAILVLAPRGLFNWPLGLALFLLDVKGLPWFGATMLWYYLFKKDDQAN